MHEVNVRSYPERFFSWIPLPYWLGILMAWELVFLMDYLLGLGIEGGHDHLIEYGCLVLCFALTCSTIIFCSRTLAQMFPDVTLFIDHDPELLAAWYQRQLAMSYEGWWPLVFGVGFAVVESLTVGTMIRPFTPEGTTLAIYRAGYEFIGFFFLGVGIWALINVVRIPVLLARHRVVVSLSQVSDRGLLALGSSFFKMSLSIIATFTPLVVAAIVSPLSDNVVVLFWLGGGVILIFGFFVLPQVGLHRIMAHEKRQRLLAFTTHLEEALERSLKDPTSENLQRLKELFDLQVHLKNMNEWPFNTNTIWQLITALLIPLVLTIMEIFF